VRTNIVRTFFLPVCWILDNCNGGVIQMNTLNLNIVRMLKVMLFAATMMAAAYWGGKWVKLKTVIAASRAPYTIFIEQRVSRTGPDGRLGEPFDVQTLAVARASDGSLSEVHFLPGVSQFTSDPSKIRFRKVTSISQKAEVHVYSRGQSVSTFPLEDAELAARKQPAQDPTCQTHPQLAVQPKFVGIDTFKGLRVLKFQAPRSGPTGDIWEAWESPDFDCAPVFLSLTTYNADGSVKEYATKAATWLSREEPSASLFDTVGIERPPSQAVEMDLRQDRPEAQVPGNHEGYRRIDERYWELKKK